MYKIGENLKAIRKEKGFTQSYVAEQLGIRQNTYSQYESDKRQPDIDTLHKLRLLFDKSLDEIFGFKVSSSSLQDSLEKVALRIEMLKEESSADLSTEEILDILGTSINEMLIKESIIND